MGTPAKHISFKFKEGSSEAEVAQGLDAVNRIAGIFNTQALFPDKADPVLKLMYITRVEPAVDSRALVQQIKDLPHIEFAHIPAARRLI